MNKKNFYFSRFCKIWLKFIIELQVFHSLLSRIKAIQCWRKEGEGKRRQGGKIREAAFRYQQRHRWGVGNRKAGGWKRLRPVVSPRTAATLPRSLSAEAVPLSLSSAHLRGSSADFPARFPPFDSPFELRAAKSSHLESQWNGIKTENWRGETFEVEPIVTRLHSLEKKVIRRGISLREIFTKKGKIGKKMW